MKDVHLQYIPFLIVISGPSGAGKSSITQQILNRNPDILYSVSVTTRPMRKREVDGVDYYFTSDRDFRDKIEKNEFIEWALVHGAYYGTPRTPILEAFEGGKKVLLDIDVQGGKQIREKFEKGVFIFVLPPSRKVLAERLQGRMTDKNDVIERRLREAGREVEELTNYHYLVVNSNLEDSVARVEEIIRVEECKVQRIKEKEEWIEAFQSE
jgi:guanylate kinase